MISYISNVSEPPPELTGKNARAGNWRLRDRRTDAGSHGSADEVEKRDKAFNQLNSHRIDKQMERFAQYDMDGLAGVSDLNDVLDELDRQAPLPPLTNNEGGARCGGTEK